MGVNTTSLRISHEILMNAVRLYETASMQYHTQYQ